MKSQLDVVGIADGDVSVSIDELNVFERLKLLRMYVRPLESHYSGGHKGGTGFRSWHSDNFGDPLSTHSVRRYYIQGMDAGLRPSDSDYNTQTRIATLSADYVLLPEFKEPKASWELGDVQLLTRFCLTNGGALYLEWYEGKVTKMDKKHPNLPERITLMSAEYHKIGSTIEGKALERIETVLEKRPRQLFSFALGVLRLISCEAEQKEKAALRSRSLFNELNIKGYIFGINRRM